MCDCAQGSLCPSPMGIRQCMWIQLSILQKLPHTYIHTHTTYILHTTYRISDHIVSQARQKKMPIIQFIVCIVHGHCCFTWVHYSNGLELPSLFSPSLLPSICTASQNPCIGGSRYLDDSMMEYTPSSGCITKFLAPTIIPVSSADVLLSIFSFLLSIIPCIPFPPQLLCSFLHSSLLLPLLQYLPVFVPPVRTHALVVVAALMIPWRNIRLSLGCITKFLAPPVTSISSLGCSTPHSLVRRRSRLWALTSLDTRMYCEISAKYTRC